MKLLRNVIMSRLAGGRVKTNRVDPTLPLLSPPSRTPLRVAVVGGGLAGMSAALLLGERGQRVTLFERNDYLGGKVGSWQVPLPDGGSANVSHGFHAFFRQYYNLRRVLGRIGADGFLRPLSDYLIVTDQRRFSFAELSSVPVLNIGSMLRARFFDPGIFLRPNAWRLVAMLAYERDRSFANWDHVSFEDFANRAGLSRDFRTLMNNVCRAYFASEREMSTAEMFKATHAYFFSNDLGLVYDYLCDDFGRTLLTPFERALRDHHVELRTGTPVGRIDADGDGFAVDGERFDRLVLASDLATAQRLLAGGAEIARRAPSLVQRLRGLRNGRPYSVARLWLDRDPFAPDLPVFVFLQRKRFLDSLTLVHRAEEESARWAEAHGGAVIELHCYAVDEDVAPSAEAIRDGMLDELHHYLPEARAAKVVYEHLQLRDDFTSYEVGQDAHRPGTVTEIPGLTLAGDWVRLPVPVMLMEAACTSGLMAANTILAELGLRPEPIESVPLRGLFAPGPRDR